MLRLVNERDELNAALLDFERHVEDIQSEVKALSNDREHFISLYKQVSFRNIMPAGKSTHSTQLRNVCVHSGSRGAQTGPKRRYVS